MYSVSTKVNSYLAYFMVNHPFGTTPSARPFGQFPATVLE